MLSATAPVPRNASLWGSARAEELGACISTRRRFLGGMQGNRIATPRLVKLVLSATMTRDPTRVGQLMLHAPRLISLGDPEERCAASAVLSFSRLRSRVCSSACVATKYQSCYNSGGWLSQVA